MHRMGAKNALLFEFRNSNGCWACGMRWRLCQNRGSGKSHINRWLIYRSTSPWWPIDVWSPVDRQTVWRWLCCNTSTVLRASTHATNPRWTMAISFWCIVPWYDGPDALGLHSFGNRSMSNQHWIEKNKINKLTICMCIVYQFRYKQNTHHLIKKTKNK